MEIFPHNYHNALLLLLLLPLLLMSSCGATDHIVGANRGWNAGINYSSWAHNQTFYVGDLISFRYQKNTYNVFAVNETGYDNCTTDGSTGNWTSGKDFIPLNKSQKYYFICNGFCFGGMKVEITVHDLPKNMSDARVATRGGVTGNRGVRRGLGVWWVGVIVGGFFGLI